MDVESLPEWSGPHKAAAIVSEHDDGTPDQVTMTVSAAGVNDDQTVSYAWTDNTCSWSLIESKMLAEQQGKYTVTPSGDGSHVEFELEIDLKVKLPGMLVKRGQKTAVETARKVSPRSRSAAQKPDFRRQNPMGPADFDRQAPLASGWSGAGRPVRGQ